MPNGVFAGAGNVIVLTPASTWNDWLTGEVEAALAEIVQLPRLTNASTPAGVTVQMPVVVDEKVTALFKLDTADKTGGGLV